MNRKTIGFVCAIGAAVSGIIVIGLTLASGEVTIASWISYLNTIVGTLMLVLYGLDSRHN